jgi:hypothetical protein
VTDDSPGTLRLHLEASSKGTRVLDGDDQDLGHIDVIVPKLVYTMRREERPHLEAFCALTYAEAPRGPIRLRWHVAVLHAIFLVAKCSGCAERWSQSSWSRRFKQKSMGL